MGRFLTGLCILKILEHEHRPQQLQGLHVQSFYLIHPTILEFLGEDLVLIYSEKYTNRLF